MPRVIFPASPPGGLIQYPDEIELFSNADVDTAPGHIIADYAGAIALEPYVAPAAASSWAAFDFYRRFSLAERVAIRALSDTDHAAAEFLATLNATLAAGRNVVSDDPDLLTGIAYLQANPAAAPILTAARAAEILGP